MDALEKSSARGLARSPAVIAIFFLKVAIIYGILVVPQLRGADVYGGVFRAAANVFFGTVGGTGRATFERNPVAHMVQDTTITVQNLRKGVRGQFEINTYLMGYLATSFVIALILSSPVPWKRRLVALGAGLALISVFVGLRLYLKLADVLSDENPLAVYSFSPLTKKTVVTLGKVLGISPVTTYIAPIFIWILVTFRREDVVRLGPNRVEIPPAQWPASASHRSR